MIRSISVRGLYETRKKWEAHWANALTDDDLQWLTGSAHCNHIRLPVGYFTLGPGFCANTAFAMQPAQVYINAWSAVKSLVSRCFAHGIGVLIDLHGVPGGANSETHSGTSSGDAALWHNPFNLELATKCLMFIAEEIIRDPQLAGVVGIQLCNEAIIDPPDMYEWYNHVIQRISALDASLPLYISDGWDLGRAVRFTRAYNTVTNPPHCPVIVDSHKYYVFSEEDTSRAPHEIIAKVKSELHELDSSLVGDVFTHQAAVAVYIGEYSLALAPQTWAKAPAEQKHELMRQFGNEQSKMWQEKGCGSAFWTFKMDWMPGWEWGLKACTDAGQINPPRSLTLTVKQVRQKLSVADELRGGLLRDALGGHANYWNVTSPGGKFEHWRYADGWDLGWRDARDFFAARIGGVVPWTVGSGSRNSVNIGGMDGTSMSHEPTTDIDENAPVGADMIGALDLWVLKRLRSESVADHQHCPFGWEFEHGFRAGVKEFGRVVD